MTRAARYRSLFERGGRRVTIERPRTNTTPVRAEGVRVRIRGIDPEEIGGGIDANARKVLVLAEDVPAELRPLREGDRVILDGLTLRFSGRPDDQAHRDGETLLAYEAIATGA